MKYFINLIQKIRPNHNLRKFGTSVAIGTFLIGISGCATDSQPEAVSPRDLISDVSIQADSLLQRGPTKIGVLLPLSGPQAELGQQLWNAAVLSLFDSGREDIVLMPHDTNGTAAGAISAAENAASNGSNLIVGPLFTTSVSAARPILARYGLRGIALSNNSSEAREPFFLIGNHPETQIDALVSYLESTGRKRIKLFGPDIRYVHILHDRLTQLDKVGRIQLIDTRMYRTSASYTQIAQDVRAVTIYDKRARALKDFTAIFSDSWKRFEDPDEALQAALEKLEGRVEQARLQFASFAPHEIPNTSLPRKVWGVTAEEYDLALSEFLPIYHRHRKSAVKSAEAMDAAIAEFEQRETLGKTDFDAVLMPVGGRPLLVIAPMFEYFNAANPDVWLLGTDIWEDTVQGIPKDLIGSRFVTARSAGWADFQKRFQKAFGHRPTTIAITAYDAISVAVTEKAETGRAILDANFLTRPQGFDGVNGKIRFAASGTNERTLNILQLKHSGTENVFTWTPDQYMPGTNIGIPGGGGPSQTLPSARPGDIPSVPISALNLPAPPKS